MKSVNLLLVAAICLIPTFAFNAGGGQAGKRKNVTAPVKVQAPVEEVKQEVTQATKEAISTPPTQDAEVKPETTTSAAATEATAKIDEKIAAGKSAAKTTEKSIQDLTKALTQETVLESCKITTKIITDYGIEFSSNTHATFSDLYDFIVKADGLATTDEQKAAFKELLIAAAANSKQPTSKSPGKSLWKCGKDSSTFSSGKRETLEKIYLNYELAYDPSITLVTFQGQTFVPDLTYKGAVFSAPAFDSNFLEEFIKARTSGLNTTNLIKRCYEVNEAIKTKGIGFNSSTASYDDLYEFINAAHKITKTTAKTSPVSMALADVLTSANNNTIEPDAKKNPGHSLWWCTKKSKQFKQSSRRTLEDIYKEFGITINNEDLKRD